VFVGGVDAIESQRMDLSIPRKVRVVRMREEERADSVENCPQESHDEAW
jgi:hypothetical protein